MEDRMICPLTLRRLVVGALFLTPAAMLAQAPMSTGTTAIGSNDPFWDVSVNGGAFYDASVLDRTGGTATSNWIGASPSGSLPGGDYSQNFEHFLYSYQTSFMGASGMTLTFQCARDDAFFSLMLNDAVITDNAACPGYGISNSFTLANGFRDGMNVLQFNIGGNGVTDGLQVNITGVTNETTTTPEPNTLLLVASGLVGLVVVGRGRFTA
jgi:hypothetical protein